MVNSVLVGGQTGNSSINSYVWGVNMQQVYTSLGAGYRPQNIPNLDVKWEKQEQINLGLDLGFLNDRINVTLDWYQKESKDMLMDCRCLLTWVPRAMITLNCGHRWVTTGTSVIPD